MSFNLGRVMNQVVIGRFNAELRLKFREKPCEILVEKGKGNRFLS